MLGLVVGVSVRAGTHGGCERACWDSWWVMVGVSVHAGTHGGCERACWDSWWV